MEQPAENRFNARQRSQLQTRQRLLTAATLLFAEHGVAGTRAGDIARHAEVAVGTFYLHFGDKLKILGEILAAGVTELKRALADLPGHDNDPGELIRARMQRIVALVAENRPLARVLFMPEVLATRPGSEIIDYLVKSQEATIIQQQNMNIINHNLPPTICARAFVGMLVHVLGWWANDPEVADSESICSTLIELRTSVLQRPPDDTTQ